MSKQVTVRLPDELVAFMDERIKRGNAAGRAAVMASALERERRRLIAEHDAAILAALPQPDDLDDLAEFAASTRFDDLD